MSHVRPLRSYFTIGRVEEQISRKRICTNGRITCECIVGGHSTILVNYKWTDRDSFSKCQQQTGKNKDQVKGRTELLQQYVKNKSSGNRTDRTFGLDDLAATTGLAACIHQCSTRNYFCRLCEREWRRNHLSWNTVQVQPPKTAHFQYHGWCPEALKFTSICSCGFAPSSFMGFFTKT